MLFSLVKKYFEKFKQSYKLEYDLGDDDFMFDFHVLFLEHRSQIAPEAVRDEKPLKRTVIMYSRRHSF